MGWTGERHVSACRMDERSNWRKDTGSIGFVNNQVTSMIAIARMRSLRLTSAAMLAVERRRRIAEIIRSRGVVAVAEMAETLGTSEITLRRDLRVMAKEGLLARTPGGARAHCELG